VKIETNAAALAEAAVDCAGRVGKRVDQPTLTGLHLKMAGGRLAVTGFDGGTAVQRAVEASGEDGELLVSGPKFAELAKSLPSKPVQLTVEDGRLVVRCASVLAKLPLMPMADYPSVPTVDTTIGRVEIGAFRRLVLRVAAASDLTGANGLAALMGIQLAFTGDTITATASDRYRFGLDTLADASWQPKLDEDEERAERVMFVNAGVLSEFAKSLAKSPAPWVDIEATKFVVRFSAGGRRVVSSLISGDFPGAFIRAQLPARSEHPVRVSTTELVEALKRCERGLEAKDVQKVQLSFIGDDLVVSSASGLTSNEVSSGLGIEYHGSPFAIYAKPGFVADALVAADSAHALIHLPEKPTQPFLVTVEGDEHWSHLIMPLRVSAA